MCPSSVSLVDQPMLIVFARRTLIETPLLLIHQWTLGTAVQHEL
jgi:hypothetical protein